MTWSDAQSYAAIAQGWDLFTTGGAEGHPPWELQRIDFPEDESDAVFPGDQEAHEFVRRQAEAGDSLALAAIAFLEERSPEEHATVMESKHENWG